ILCGGALLFDCLSAARDLAKDGLDVGVVNARFVKPIDRDVVRRALEETGFILTVEEAALSGGFGSAVLEVAAEMHLDTSRIRRIGIPDRYVEHGDRGQLLSDIGLDSAGIGSACRELSEQIEQPTW
ncbi:MAG: transketolase C-terminal domain-containing protein, partial [Pirellulaceae bacterium]